MKLKYYPNQDIFFMENIISGTTNSKMVFLNVKKIHDGRIYVNEFDCLLTSHIVTFNGTMHLTFNIRSIKVGPFQN